MKVVKWIFSLLLSLLLIASLFTTAVVISFSINDYGSILSEFGFDLEDFIDDDYGDIYDDPSFDPYDEFNDLQFDPEELIEMIQNGEIDEQKIKEMFSDPKVQKQFVELIEQNKSFIKMYFSLSGMDSEQLIDLLKDFPEMQQALKEVLED